MRYMLSAFLLMAASAASAEVNLGFISQPGDWIGQGQTRNYDEANATFRYSASADRSRIEVSLDTLDGTEWWRLELDGPNGTPLTVGRYDDASRYPFNDASSNGLNLSGTGRGCNRLSGEFTIEAIGYSADGRLEYLSATFIQVCETFMPPLEGYVVIDTRPAVPLTVDVTVEPEGTVYRWGKARIEGEVACTGTNTVEITGTVRQGTYSADFSTTSTCGEDQAWWHADAAAFKRGWAYVDVTATVRRPGDPAESASANVAQKVRLRK